LPAPSQVRTKNSGCCRVRSCTADAPAGVRGDTLTLRFLLPSRRATLPETDKINLDIRKVLDVSTVAWRVEVTLVELKDIQLPAR
jgi:regulator of protease activity HflC (stomatin/prohibitin superfamily)